MEELLRDWDGESVVVRYDRASDAWIFIAIHDRTLGMALGGCRVHLYPSPREGLRDALRLGQGMTLKWAALDFPFGGGKAVLAPRRPLDAATRQGLLLRFGELVESLGGAYGTGADLGTTAADMDVIGRRTRFVAGRSPENGGTGDPGPWTAIGVFAGMSAAAGAVFRSPDLADRTVLVQGVGGVGIPLAGRLADAGARVLVSDALPTRAAAVAAAIGAEIVSPEAAYETPCDIFAPCAIGGILNGRSIPRLRCRIVAGSANNQLEEDADADRLHEHGIIYAPDFLINAGGAIALSSREMLGWSREEAEARVDGIGDTLREVFSDAERRGESPVREARRRADRVLAAARERRLAVA